MIIFLWLVLLFLVLEIIETQLEAEASNLNLSEYRVSLGLTQVVLYSRTIYSKFA